MKFLTFEESYNVKLTFYSVKLVSIALLLAVGLGNTHTNLAFPSVSDPPNGVNAPPPHLHLYGGVGLHYFSGN